jgi:hypothetical protein
MIPQPTLLDIHPQNKRMSQPASRSGKWRLEPLQSPCRIVPFKRKKTAKRDEKASLDGMNFIF